MPVNSKNVLPKRLILSLSLAPCLMSSWTAAWAICNGGTTVTGALTVSASCDGGSVKPLTLGTGANVTINSGVTVSNDAGSGRNGDPVSVLSTATSSALTNNGIISTGQQWGVTVNGTLTSLVNSGTISSTVRRAVAIAAGGTITTLTNTGTIKGPFAGVTNSGVALQTFNNGQGAGNVNGAVTYAGLMPVNYNVIINSTTNYGKLAGIGVTGSSAFGIYGTSTVAAGTYTGVLTGLTTSNISTTSGTFGGLNWLLSLASGSTNIWDLIFTIPVTNINAGGTYTLATIGTTVNPVFDGGTLALTSGASSSQVFTLNAAGGTITSPGGGTAQLSGVISGVGPLAVNGAGTLVLSGANTYAGGTTLSSGTLTFSGASALGSGPVFVSAGSTLMGTGTIAGALRVAGTFKPGNSPGYVAAGSGVTMNSGSTYQQDIAGTVQASASSPAGATGYYSFLNITGPLVIQPNATLTPRLSNLFTAGESGFGSTPYAPVLGDRFRIATASGGISGKFSTLTRPAELAAATQLVQFYNVSGSNSLDLAVIPASYASTLGNNAAVASVLDRIVASNQAGTASSAQDQLLYAASARTAATLPAFARALSGEGHAANLAVVLQASLRVQQAVMSRMGADAAPFVTDGRTGASGSSNPAATSAASKAACALMPASSWGEVVGQRSRRTGDANASDFSGNLYQLVLATDACLRDGIKIGGGIAVSKTEVNSNEATGTIQQGALFAYGKLPVDAFFLDGMASYGMHATDASRTDPTGIATSLQSSRPRGNDALISAGASRPFDMQSVRITPYTRLTWQRVTQSSFAEGASAAALTVNSFSNSGTRAVIGVTANSPAADARKANYSYQLDLAVGRDTSGLINPVLNASLAGTTTTIATPEAGSAFVQAGFYGQARFAQNAFAYLGLAVEARSRSTQGNVTVGARMLF